MAQSARDAGLPGLLHVWDFTRDGRAKKGADPGFEERAADQLEFLARTRHKSHAGMAGYLREELGFGQLINANNWRTVDLVTTRARIDGEQSDCFRILSVGKPPLQVEKVEAVLTIANPRLSKASLLDINGMATSTPVDVKRAEGKATIRLPANTVYLVLQ